MQSYHCETSTSLGEHNLLICSNDDIIFEIPVNVYFALIDQLNSVAKQRDSCVVLKPLVQIQHGAYKRTAHVNKRMEVTDSEFTRTTF